MRVRAIHYADDITNWLNVESPAGYGKNSQASRERVLALLAAIQEVRSNYPLRSSVAEEGIKEAAVRYAVIAVEIRSTHGEMWEWHKKTKSIPFGESRAVWKLFEMARTGSFHLLRKCGECERWFYARTVKSVGCNGVHQRKLYEKTDQYKAYKAAYMRDRYWPVKNSGKAIRERRGRKNGKG